MISELKHKMKCGEWGFEPLRCSGLRFSAVSVSRVLDFWLETHNEVTCAEFEAHSVVEAKSELELINMLITDSVFDEIGVGHVNVLQGLSYSRFVVIWWYEDFMLSCS